jgi:exopolysaccharide production protein ExoZ
MIVNSRKASPHLVSVQLLRAIAAATVVFGHAEAEAFQATSDFNLIGFDFGIGVDVFFIISGFVMWLSSSHLFGRPESPLVFLKKRFLRVVPLYWLYTVAMLAAIAIFPSKLNNPDITLEMIVSSFVFLPHPNTIGEYNPVLALGWTLNYEMFFYALFALSLLLERNKGFVTLCGLILGCVVLWKISGAGPIEFWGRPIILEFLIGVMMARLYQERGHTPNKYMFALCMAVAAISYALLSGSESRLIGLGIPSAFFAAGFIFFLPGRLNSLLSGIARVGGDSSYTLYLSHPFVLAIVKILWLEVDGGASMPWVYVGVATLACVLSGYVLYLVVERPMLRFWQGKGGLVAGLIRP